jgi:hypothetical protein
VLCVGNTYLEINDYGNKNKEVINADWWARRKGNTKNSICDVAGDISHINYLKTLILSKLLVKFHVIQSRFFKQNGVIKCISVS